MRVIYKDDETLSGEIENATLQYTMFIQIQLV